MKSPLLKHALYLAAFGLVASLAALRADSLTVEGDLNVEGKLGVGTATPTEKLEVNGNVKVNGTLTTTGTVTATSITLPDGSTLTSAKSTTLYNAAGQAVATVGPDGKVNFTNGLSVGSDPAATITPNSAVYLNQTLANLGYRENPIQGTPIKSIAYTGEVTLTAIAQDASYLYVVGYVSGYGSIGGHPFWGASGSSAIAKVGQNGDSLWIAIIEGDIRLNSVAVDGSGNVVVAGYFNGTTTGLSSPASNLTSNGSGSDGIVVKYNASGASQWAQRVGGSGSDVLNSVAVDGSGNVVVAGYFNGTTSGLSSPANNLTSNGDQDGIVVKYNTSGASQWAQRVGGSNYDDLNSVAVDGNGNVVVAGSFIGTTTGLSIPASNVTSNGSASDGIVVKYNASGVSQWAQRVGGINYDYLTSVAVDGGGNVLAAGQFSDTTTGLSNPASNLMSSGPYYDGLVVKYNASGASQWAQRLGGAGSDIFRALQIQGNLVWSLGGVGIDSSSVPFGNSRIAPGTFVVGWSEFPVITPAPGAPASFAWGASTATNTGVALGASAYANASGSVAFGVSSATAQNAFASGSSSALSDNATAMGLYAQASGSGSTAIGRLTTASGNGATAMGEYAVASGSGSTAMGIEVYASGNGAVAMGTGSSAAGHGATAMGEYTNAGGYGATATGLHTSATGEAAVAMGSQTTANSYASVVFGRLNVVQGNPETWILTDDIFVIGNGNFDTSEPSNAFVIHKNGNTRIAGNVQAKGGFRTPPMGDLQMGEFTAGANPAAPSTDPEPGLDAGLRYPNE